MKLHKGVGPFFLGLSWLVSNHSLQFQAKVLHITYLHINFSRRLTQEHSALKRLIYNLFPKGKFDLPLMLKIFYYRKTISFHCSAFQTPCPTLHPMSPIRLIGCWYEMQTLLRIVTENSIFLIITFDKIENVLP